jgi:hypothetical protein
VLVLALMDLALFKGALQIDFHRHFTLALGPPRAQKILLLHGRISRFDSLRATTPVFAVPVLLMKIAANGFMMEK